MERRDGHDGLGAELQELIEIDVAIGVELINGGDVGLIGAVDQLGGDQILVGQNCVGVDDLHYQIGGGHGGAQLVLRLHLDVVLGATEPGGIDERKVVAGPIYGGGGRWEEHT